MPSLIYVICYRLDVKQFYLEPTDNMLTQSQIGYTNQPKINFYWKGINHEWTLPLSWSFNFNHIQIPVVSQECEPSMICLRRVTLVRDSKFQSQNIIYPKQRQQLSPQLMLTNVRVKYNITPRHRPSRQWSSPVKRLLSINTAVSFKITFCCISEVFY